MPIYLDCNATTPVDPEVRDYYIRFLSEDYGNEGSRTHAYGARAKQLVQKARDHVAAVVGAKRDEILFTSGATESNNLALLGLLETGRKLGRRHIVTTSIEHKAVHEPCAYLEKQGFEVTRLDVGMSGVVSLDALRDALRPDTHLVSVMHVNNETGIVQPIEGVAEILASHSAFFHTDAAQGFGKDLNQLQHPRIDLISVSGHKIFAPKGVGALVVRRRGYQRIPMQPLMFGGGQERGLRPGTLPVGLIAALGLAAEIAIRDAQKRHERCRKIRQAALNALGELHPKLTGNQDLVMDHVLNLAFPGLDSEALIVALKDLVAISNGSACTSNSYTPSHVLTAMGMNEDEANSCIRMSWCHMTPDVDWPVVVKTIQTLLQ